MSTSRGESVQSFDHLATLDAAGQERFLIEYATQRAETLSDRALIAGVDPAAGSAALYVEASAQPLEDPDALLALGVLHFSAPLHFSGKKLPARERFVAVITEQQRTRSSWASSDLRFIPDLVDSTWLHNITKALEQQGPWRHTRVYDTVIDAHLRTGRVCTQQILQ